MNSKTAKQARRVIKTIRVRDEKGNLVPLHEGDLWEVENVRQHYHVDRGVKELWGGLFWMPRITPYQTATFRHSRSTVRGAYRALKRKLKEIKRDSR